MIQQGKKNEMYFKYSSSYLPVLCKCIKVIKLGHTITSKQFASLVVTKHTTSTAKCFFGSLGELDTGKFIKIGQNNSLVGVDTAQINNKLAFLWSLLLHGYWKATNRLDLAHVNTIEVPTVATNLKDVISNTNDNGLVVCPVTDNLCTGMDVKALTTCKGLVSQKNKIALTVHLIMELLPGLIMWITLGASIGSCCFWRKKGIKKVSWLEYISLKKKNNNHERNNNQTIQTYLFIPGHFENSKARRSEIVSF